MRRLFVGRPLRIVGALSLGLVLLSIAGISQRLYQQSSAATPFITAEADAGTLTAPATKLADATASGGSAVKFGASSPTPAPTPTPTPSPGGFQANCIAKPSACGYPDATNTGVPAGTTLTASGSVTASTNGQVIQNLRITDGQIVVKANNVTIKNVLITGCTYYPIDYGEQYSGLVVQDTEINSTCALTTAGMSFGNYTAIRMNVHGTADGFKANNNATIQDSYIHDLAVTADSHNDGVQSTGGGTVTFKHNTCDTNAGGVCIQFGAADSNWSVTNNLVRATGWSFNGANVSNSTFTGNRFVRLASWYGPMSVQGTGNTIAGNYYDDNNAAAQ